MAKMGFTSSLIFISQIKAENHDQILSYAFLCRFKINQQIGINHKELVLHVGPLITKIRRSILPKSALQLDEGGSPVDTRGGKPDPPRVKWKAQDDMRNTARLRVHIMNGRGEIVILRVDS